MNQSIVLIHGLGLGEWIFQEHFVPHYRSQGYDVHTFDLPGHAPHSTANERQRITLESCVRFVEEYLEANIPFPFVIVGMSMGGAICQKLLEKGYSNRNLRGIVLLSPVPPANNQVFTLRLCRKLALTDPQVLIDFFSEKPNPRLMFSPETLSGFSADEIESRLRKIVNGFPRLEYALFFQDLVARPFPINVPLKIIGGEDDQLFSPEVVDFTASYYSRRAEILPGLGHMIPVEYNFRYGIHAVDSFLNEVF